jgi:LPS export ABC transporter protein LptC
MPNTCFRFRFRCTIIAVMILFFSCENDINEVNKITKKPEPYASEVIKQLDIIYSDSATVRMHMMAPVMKHYVAYIKDPYEELPEGVYIEFFNDSARVKSTLKANYAIRYDQTHYMEARNHVVVVNENGEQLFTEHLIWDESARKIKTNGYVKIVTQKETLEGSGMVANEDFSEWEILNPKGLSEFETDSITNRK